MNLIRRNVEPVESTALPPWEAVDARGRRAMMEWVIAQLDAQDGEDEMRQDELDAERNYHAPLPLAEQQRLRFEEAIRRARGGNVGSLRRLYPEITEFIHPPKRPRGRRRKYPRDNWGRYAASMIAADVKRVRELWKANYKGKWKRRGLRPTAEEIVAERRGWTEDEVIAAIKLLSR
jgi:hypothetical protein